MPFDKRTKIHLKKEFIRYEQNFFLSTKRGRNSLSLTLNQNNANDQQNIAIATKKKQMRISFVSLFHQNGDILHKVCYVRSELHILSSQVNK